MQRTTWDEYFLQIARLVASRSTCLRKQVGAVIVKDRHILATGYNGSPQGTRHCTEIGCVREEMKIPHGARYEMCRACHGEENAILQSARHGVSIEGADIYCTHKPCINCTKMILNSGIKRVFYETDDLPLNGLQEDLIAQAKVEFIQLKLNGQNSQNFSSIT
ncbi:MAG: cytidine/deoxycytidylate deaminase family protein [Synergistaceae bacterium]|nr:cytidine/deoxycytidylate deaminase family protein [Synergistaceae bacterium]